MKKLLYPMLISSIIFSIPHTNYQISSTFKEEFALPTSGVIVYGKEAEKIKGWKDKGYTIWSMFSASWLGKEEKIVKENPEIVQATVFGNFEMIPGRTWVVPTKAWIEHCWEASKSLIEAGAEAILPEEPEFFTMTGYSKAFKEEWEKFYKTEWEGPYSSTQAFFLASQLKSILFYNYYLELFKSIKENYPDVKCLIPIHSNPNYFAWNIISPHYLYYTIPYNDGFIAQVWSDTILADMKYEGERKSFPFERSYLEYNFFVNLVRDSNKEIYFLTDPVRDISVQEIFLVRFLNLTMQS